jgi:hypothetical protein
MLNRHFIDVKSELVHVSDIIRQLESNPGKSRSDSTYRTYVKLNLRSFNFTWQLDPTLP